DLQKCTKIGNVHHALRVPCSSDEDKPGESPHAAQVFKPLAPKRRASSWGFGVFPLLQVCSFPMTNSLSRGIEQTLVIPSAYLETCVRNQLPPYGRPHIENRVVPGGVRGRHRIGPEEETIGMPVQHRGY